MSTMLRISPTTLGSVGSTLTSDENDGSLRSIGTTLTAAATTLSLNNENIVISSRAEELRTTKAYVQSLSEEERVRMFELLDEQEEIIEQKDGKTLSLKK